MANRGSYPHPVVDNSDDVSSSFEVLNVLVAPFQQDIEITYEIRTDDPDLESLIDSGQAKHSLRWRCSSTISTGEMAPDEFQRTKTGYKLRAWLDQQLVRGDVDADVRIVTSGKLNDHSWTNQHSDYAGAGFDLRAGDVLADGGSFRFNAEKTYDPLDPPVGSFFKFVRSTKLRKRIAVAFDGDETVDVKIPAKTFDRFKLLAHRPDFQIALVVLPALLETLGFIKLNDGDEPLDDKVWYRELNALVEKNGGWELSVLELAQRILESPIDAAVLKGLITEEED